MPSPTYRQGVSHAPSDDVDTNNNVDSMDTSGSAVTERQPRSMQRRMLKRRATSSSPCPSPDVPLKVRRSRSLHREVENNQRKRSFAAVDPSGSESPAPKRRDVLLQSPSLESLSLNEKVEEVGQNVPIPVPAQRRRHLRHYECSSQCYPICIGTNIMFRRHRSLPENGYQRPLQVRLAPDGGASAEASSTRFKKLMKMDSVVDSDDVGDDNDAKSTNGSDQPEFEIKMADSRDGSDHLSDRELDYDEDDAPSDTEHHESFASENGVNDDDLYDTALEPTANSDKHDNVSVVSSAPPTSTTQTTTQSGTVSSSSATGKRYCCYVGNMTWWTTDEDLTNLASEIGCNDLLDIKFYENRNNGQSKGYALVMFASEPSVKTCLEVLPSRLLHNQSLVVLPYTKASLAKFEEATKRMEARTEKKETKPEKQPGFVGTVRLGASAGAVPPITQMGLNQLRPQQFTGPAVPLMRANVGAVSMSTLGRGVNMSGPPPQSMGSMSRPPPSYGNPRPLNQPPPNFPPPGAHINPNVFPGYVAGQIGAPAQTEQMSEAEFEDVMGRNRTVASSAVTRAVQDAAAGDVHGAIETLMTAMSLIRQSRVAHDERCKALVNSLQDTLHGLENKPYPTSRKHRSSGRDRSRTPERSRKRHRRSRSRSRSRDRYDYSPRHRRY